MPDHIFDNTVLSNLASVGRLDLLRKRYVGSACTVEVCDELRKGVYTFWLHNPPGSSASVPSSISLGTPVRRRAWSWRWRVDTHAFYPHFANLQRKVDTMTVRTSSAEWKGSLKDGSGTIQLASGAYEGPYSYASRFESGTGTNPEELIGAAHAGCFSMFLAALLSKAGFRVARIHTTAAVHLGAGPTITLIELKMEAEVLDIGEAEFQEHAEAAKKNCPVSKALAATATTLSAKLVG
jgi:osmotically inducible protein OsmC